MSATDAKAITRAYFDSLLLEQRLMGTCMPDAVSVGAHLIPKAVESAEAVAARLREMTAELRGTMAFTGVEDTKHFDPTVLHRI